MGSLPLARSHRVAAAERHANAVGERTAQARRADEGDPKALKVMTVILLARHGHVDGIKPQRFRGRADLALTVRGHEQARLAAQRIASRWLPNSIYTSPLQRCVATAAAISAACDVPFENLGGLNDLDYGAWQFLTLAQAQTEDPELFATWFASPQRVRFPNGESLQDVATRTADVLRYVLSRHQGDTVVLVGHDSVNRVLLTQLLEMPLSSYWRFVQDPCCINEVEVTNGVVQLRRMNDTSHL
jgi:broad specificity phosphatase PhoE